MAIGWSKLEKSEPTENDEGSNLVVANDLVVDRRMNIPYQNSNPIQVVDLFQFSSVPSYTLEVFNQNSYQIRSIFEQMPRILVLTQLLGTLFLTSSSEWSATKLPDCFNFSRLGPEFRQNSEHF